MFKTANTSKAARPQYLAVFAVTRMVIGFKDRQRVKTATANCWRGWGRVKSLYAECGDRHWPFLLLNRNNFCWRKTYEKSKTHPISSRTVGGNT